MANNKIQIKRSSSTATPASLSAGELAFSNVTGGSGVLFIGSTDGGTVVPVGGVRNPGTLTANQALVANATSGIDKIITANLTLSSFSVNTINAVANLTNLGAASNSELTTTWAIKTFVDAKIASASNPQGSNGQFQYNDEGVLAGTPNMTYDKTTNTVTVGNTTSFVQLGYITDLSATQENQGNVNTYLQVAIENSNSGTSASADFAAYNDDGTYATFIDMGINSSNWSNAQWTISGGNDGYLYTGGGNLTIGTNADSKYVSFFTGGSLAANERMRIDGSGNVAIGATSADAKLKVSGTANISGITTITANLVLGAGITANGSGGTAGHVLTSGAGTNAYWAAPASTVAGSNSQIQFNANGALAGDAGLTYDGVTDKLTVAGSVTIGNTTMSTVNAIFGGSFTVNGSIGSAGQVLTSAGSGAGANAYWTTPTTGTVTSVASANGISGGTITSSGTLYAIGNNGIVANSSGIWAKSANGISVDASGINVTGNNGIVANSSGVWAKQSNGITVDSSGILVNANNGIVANATGVYAKAANGVSVDASGINVLANSGLVSNTTGVFVLANTGIVSNTTGVFVNSTYITSLAANLASPAVLGSTTANGASLTYANVSGQVNTATFFATTSANVGANVQMTTTTIKVGNTTLSTTNAIFGGTITTNGSIGTAGQVLISGGAANASWTNSLGIFSFTDVTVSGNLTVLGDLVSLNVSTLAIEDPLIVLAKDQSNTTTYTDAVDIGFYGSYGNTAVASKNWTGLFRDQSDAGVFKLFSGNIPEPTTTVDTTNTNFTFATLQAQLKSGGAGASGLIANATTIAITANSTLNVAIVANTLSLSTALPVTSGGTGLNSVAVGDLLIGNSTNTITRLASGTDGYVLQINGTGVVAWNTLDGGVF